MSHHHQANVLARLESETRRAVRRLEDSCSHGLTRLWDACKSDLEAVVISMYRRDFGRDNWDVVAATNRNTLHHIAAKSYDRLVTFRDDALAHISAGLEQVRHEEMLRALWMLDQVTVPSYTPRLPMVARESGPRPQDYKAAWDTVLNHWLEAYNQSFSANLRLNALAEGSAMDAADEVTATKIDNFDPGFKLMSLFQTEAIQAQDSMREAVRWANADAVAEEVFLTLEDERVCPECDALDGKPIKERPPLHFCCRCFTSLVPKTWADQLASGDDDEKAAALLAEDRGLIPSAMVIRGSDGELQGSVAITFSDWKKNKAPYVSGKVVR